MATNTGRVTHKLWMIQFKCGHWVTACSCGDYMSEPTWEPERARSDGERHTFAVLVRAIQGAA
jgi:hypothetical protein